MIENTVSHLQNLLFTRVQRETTTLQFNIFNKRKRHISENNAHSRTESLKVKRQKTKSTYFVNNQRL